MDQPLYAYALIAILLAVIAFAVARVVAERRKKLDRRRPIKTKRKDEREGE